MLLKNLMCFNHHDYIAITLTGFICTLGKASISLAFAIQVYEMQLAYLFIYCLYTYVVLPRVLYTDRYSSADLTDPLILTEILNLTKTVLAISAANFG